MPNSGNLTVAQRIEVCTLVRWDTSHILCMLEDYQRLSRISWIHPALTNYILYCDKDFSWENKGQILRVTWWSKPQCIFECVFFLFIHDCGRYLSNDVCYILYIYTQRGANCTCWENGKEVGWTVTNREVLFQVQCNSVMSWKYCLKSGKNYSKKNINKPSINKCSTEEEFPEVTREHFELGRLFGEKAAIWLPKSCFRAVEWCPWVSGSNV